MKVDADTQLAIDALRRSMEKEPPFSRRRKRLREIIEELTNDRA